MPKKQKIQSSKVAGTVIGADSAPLQTFLATRFYPPRREGEYVARSCVESLVDDAMMYRFVSLRAPAGYGKTTTLSGCYTLLNKAEGISAWLNLTDFDGSLGEFAGYLSQAFSWSGSNKSVQSAQWENGWFEAPSFQSLSREFCNAASRFEEPAYLFLDDFDAIIDTDAERFIYQVLRDAPPNLHIIISCRSAPSFGVGRLRMQGQFAEVGVEQLRFSEADAASLLGAASTVEVEDRLISLAVKKTEGWPAGLQLVAIALAHSDSVEKLLNSFNGEIQEVGEFLAEDVLEKLDPRLTEFLIHTSILKRFSVSLANAITGRNDSREIIDELERNSLFIFSLDSEKKWYRYQSLFAGFLLRTLNDRYSNRVSALYLKASDWCVAESLIVQGAKYALNAENFSRTAEILDTHAEVLLSRGLFDTLYSLVACLPTDVLQAHPRLRLWEASYLICHRQFREAQPILMQVEEYLNELSSCNELSEENIRSLRSTLLHGKLMLAQFMDDMPSLERLCLEVLSDSVEYDGVLTGILQTSLLHAQREQYRLDEVELRSALGHESFARVDQPMLSIGLESVLGPTYAQRGEFDSAAACYWRALAACDDSVTDDALIQSGLFVLQADLFLERFEIDKARELFESDYGAINGIGFVDNLIAYFVGRARLATFDGDIEAADRLLLEGIDCAITQSLERLRWCCIDERIRQHLRRQDVWGALRVSADAGLPDKDTNLYPVGEFTTTREAMAMAWARTAQADGRPKDAIKLLKKWLSFVERHRCVKSLVRLSILTAQIYQAMGEIRSALRVLKDVMPHIAKSGMLFCLVEEAGALRQLILQVCELEDDSSESLDSFALRVQQALKTDTSRKVINNIQSVTESEQLDNVQCESLNSKEIEILRLVARSMRNKEIADLLGMTEGTVKWYLQQIYDKFDVRRRFAALERARALGYL